jgi:hypothetical protein
MLSIYTIMCCQWQMNEWVWSIGGMILTGENWSTGRRTLYSVCGRWVNEYGEMVEWYWQGKTEVLGEEHYTACVLDEWMSMEHWWNDTDKEKPKYSEKSLSQCQFFNHNSHWDWPRIEPGSPLWQANDQVPGQVRPSLIPILILTHTNVWLKGYSIIKLHIHKLPTNNKVTEDSVLVGCHAVSLDVWLPTFRRNAVLSSQEIQKELENGGTMFLRNVGNHSPNIIVTSQKIWISHNKVLNSKTGTWLRKFCSHIITSVSNRDLNGVYFNY